MANLIGPTKLKAIGERLKALRNGLPGHPSQLTLAEEIGVSRSAIAGIESGNDRAGIVTTIALADYYKVPLDWLLCRRIPPGGPLAGEFIEDLDELALIHFWRSLDESERRAVTRILRIDLSDRA